LSTIEANVLLVVVLPVVAAFCCPPAAVLMEVEAFHPASFLREVVLQVEEALNSHPVEDQMVVVATLCAAHLVVAQTVEGLKEVVLMVLSRVVVLMEEVLLKGVVRMEEDLKAVVLMVQKIVMELLICQAEDREVEVPKVVVLMVFHSVEGPRAEGPRGVDPRVVDLWQKMAASMVEDLKVEDPLQTASLSKVEGQRVEGQRVEGQRVGDPLALKRVV
jgi:hypothetical protein